MEYRKGRGAQLNTPNRFSQMQLSYEHPEGIDEEVPPEAHTQTYLDTPKRILSKVDSPDIPNIYSINPYQGCEHGCIYCYARNSHEYWGFSAGLDFEQKIVIKPDAPQLLEREFLKDLEGNSYFAFRAIPTATSHRRKSCVLPATC